MADPSHRGSRILAGLALAAAAVGCGLIPAAQGNPADPVLVSGRVLDAQGRPVAGSRIDVQVYDYSAALNVGDRVPVVFAQSFQASPDGSFEIHLAPTAVLLAYAQDQGGVINFDIHAFVGTDIAPSAFSRFVTGGTWADPPLSIDLRPIPGRAGVPTPIPGAT